MSSLADLRKKMRNPLAGASRDDLAALFENLSSTYAYNCCSHEMDNSFIDTFFGATVSNLNEKGQLFRGVCLAPYPKNGQDYAVIFQGCNYYDNYWCHVSERIVKQWKEQAKSYGHA